MYKVSIIGAGVVGTAMGYLLKQKGYTVAGIASRTMDSAGKARGIHRQRQRRRLTRVRYPERLTLFLLPLRIVPLREYAKK